MSALQPGFVLLQSNELDALRSILVDWLAQAPLPALVDETIMVQSNGMAQWLRLGLCQPRAAGGLGVSLGVSFEFPARVQWRCYRSVLGAARVPEHAPLDKSPLLWRLMRLLPPLLRDDPRFGVFYRQLMPQGTLDTARLFDLCSRLADQWDEYQVYRADWLAHWASGRNDLPAGERPMPPESAWQPALWRAVLADVAQTMDPGLAGRAGLHQAVMAQAAQRQDRPADFPPRLIVFGVSSLAPQVLDVLALAARWSQVIVCVQNPCQIYWADMVPSTPGQLGTQQRRESHPLLAAWGRQGRDLLRLLLAFEESAAVPIARRLSTDSFIESPEPRTILQQIQHDILKGLSAKDIQDAQRTPLADGSLGFHSVHSPLRAVEVLHDQLLAALTDDPSLAPHQIIVMVPDIAEYAPAIQAIFGRFPRQDPRHIPFAIADQPDQTDQAQMTVLTQLFALPQSRFERSEFLDWLAVPAIQAAFELTPPDVALLTEWLDQAAVYWGLDAEQRADFGAPATYTANSWQFGLDRLFAGYLSGDADTVWQGIVPLDEVAVSQAELIGRLQQFVNALTHARAVFAAERTPTEWVSALKGVLPLFFKVTGDDSATRWLADLHAALLEWHAVCAQAEWAEPVPAAVVQTAVFDRLASHRLTQKFLVGGVNFATLMPMRAIPYRQVYLLGMDEPAYPRRRPRQDFDLLSDRYRPGDRARREDDRYLFLEALLAAREKLSISWVGRAVKDNSPRSPSIVVHQLCDYLNMGWPSRDERSFSQALTTEHPLQPFSPAYFDGSQPGLFSFDDDWRQVHETVSTTASLPDWIPPEPCALGDLARFLKDSLDPLMRVRFGIGRSRAPEEQQDHEPFVLDGLTQWNIRHDLAQALRAEAPTDDDLDTWFARARAAIEASGQLPWRYVAWDEQFAEPLRSQWQQWQRLRAELGDDEILPGGRVISPLLSTALHYPELPVRIHSAGRRVQCHWLDHRLRDKKDHSIRFEPCLAAWPSHLAAQLSGVPVTTHLVGHHGAMVTFPPLAADEAERRLIELLSAWVEAMQSPLPLAPRTAIVWVTAALNDQQPKTNKLQAAFQGGEFGGQSDQEKLPWMARFWPDWEALSSAQSARKEQDFTSLANTLYAPLIQALTQTESAPSF